MISLVYYGIIAACVFVLTAILYQKISRLDKKSEPEKAISMEDYLFKIFVNQPRPGRYQEKKLKRILRDTCSSRAFLIM